MPLTAAAVPGRPVAAGLFSECGGCRSDGGRTPLPLRACPAYLGVPRLSAAFRRYRPYSASSRRQAGGSESGAEAPHS